MSRGVRKAYGGALALALVVIVASVIASYGGPAEASRRALDSIKVSSPNVRGDQTQRLFSLSSNGRLKLWEAGLDDARAHRVLGSGAGTFERWWVKHRDVPGKARDAHSIYVEILAELGPVGLALLLAIVALPIAAAVRARHSPLVAPALAGFITLAVHAGVDWDWEMPAVIIAGITCAGVLLLLQQRDEGRRWTVGAPALGISLVLLSALAVLSFVTLTGNRYLSESTAAFNRYDTASAIDNARRAQRWAPWSTDALQSEADAVAVDGSFTDARRVYREALAKDSGNWELWLGLALASEDGARGRHLERASLLNPLQTEIRQLREQIAVRNSAP